MIACYSNIKTQKNVDSFAEPKNHNLSNIEYQIILAIFNGNFENKQIYDYLNKNDFVKLSTVQYTMKKLLSKFSVSTRSMLFRKLIQCNYGTITINKKDNNNL